MEPSHHDQRAARRHAILCVLAASATFTLGAALIKTLTVTVPVFEIVMIRGYIAFLTMLPVLWRQGGFAAMKTRRPAGHILRTLYGFFGTFTSVYGYAFLPIVTVTALGFAMPLFLTILSVPLLGERVGWRRASAVVVGLGGVLIMLRPWNSLAEAAQQPFAVFLVVAGVVAWALAMITIRKMGEAGEKNVTIVAWFTLGTVGRFDEGLTGGRGFIGLAAMIFGAWNPIGAFGAALIFGFSESLEEKFALLDTPIPTEFLAMAPYLVTIVVVAGLVGRARPPAADGQPYEKQ